MERLVDRTSTIAGYGLGQVLEHHRREQQQAAGEDDRHHAGLVDPQGQVLARAAVDAPAADVLGALRGNAALSLGDEHHADDHAHEQHGEDQQRFHADLAAAAAQFEAALLDHGLDQICIAGARHAGEDAGHDQQADAVADAVLVDLLAQPHQEHRAGGHRHHGGQLPDEGKRAGGGEELLVDQVVLHEDSRT